MTAYEKLGTCIVLVMIVIVVAVCQCLDAMDAEMAKIDLETAKWAAEKRAREARLAAVLDRIDRELSAREAGRARGRARSRSRGRAGSRG